MLFNVANGTVDLRSRTLVPHNRDHYLTKISPVEFVPQAPCPRWKKFLEEITGNNVELISYLQRAVGYTLTGKTNEHVLFLLYGSGANGKTTFLETVHTVLGDYSRASDFSTFVDGVRSPAAARNDLAALRGARFVTACESEHGQKLAESLVKQITGGDMITARYLYGEYFEFRPQFKLWLATNHKPTIHGVDEGIWRRVHVVPFTVRIPDAKCDRDLGDKLKMEAPGILNWALRGLEIYQQQGLKKPKAVDLATENYRCEQDQFSGFLDSRCILTPTGRAQARPLFDAYMEWARENDVPVWTEREFAAKLAERGFRKVKRSFGNIWEGLTLTERGGTRQVPGDRISPGGVSGG